MAERPLQATTPARARRVLEAGRAFAVSRPFQAAAAVAFLVPLAATLGQYAHTGFLADRTRFLVLFWPGVARSWAPVLPVWLTLGLMCGAYLAGIGYLLLRRTFGTVVVLGLLGVALAQLLGAGVNHLAGWREAESLARLGLAGRVNRAIFSLWQNPTWEEVVFRGIPLLLLYLVGRTSAGRARWPVPIYLVVPNVIFALYHLPGHGPSRLVDTLVLGGIFSWLALRYTLFAPLVLHDLLDAMAVPSLAHVPDVPPAEVAWLTANAGWINSTYTLALLAALALALTLFTRRLLRPAEQPLSSPTT